VLASKTRGLLRLNLLYREVREAEQPFRIPIARARVEMTVRLWAPIADLYAGLATAGSLARVEDGNG
jgi:hypothetical protein